MARKGNKDKGVFKHSKTGEWWARWYFKGKEYRKRCDNKTQAKTLHGKKRASIREGTFFPGKSEDGETITLREMIESYMETYNGLDTNNQKRFAKWWTKILGKKKLDAITTKELEKLRNLLLTKEIKFVHKGKKRKVKEPDAPARPPKFKAPATINRYFAFLRKIYNVAIRDEYVTENPVNKLDFFKEPKGHLRFLTEGEEITLKENMMPEDFRVVRFALLTGLRQSEQFNLRWSHVDIENKVITIPRSKSGETRHVQLSRESVELLKGLNSWMTSAYVFSSAQNPKLPLDAQNFYHRVFIPALAKAKIDGVVWHTLRHTFASRLVMRGVDIASVSALMGHREISTTQRYAHLSKKHLVDAVNRLTTKTGENAENRDGTVTTTGTSQITRNPVMT